VVSLAATHRPEDLRVVILNGGGRDEYGSQLERIAASVPHDVQVVEPRGIPQVIEEIHEVTSSGDDDDGPPAKTVFVIAFGVQRLKALRQDEDAIFSMDADAGPATGEQFANILRDGPDRGVHAAVWCDSLGNLGRTFSRKTLREFDMRVLFQMSASDSSELIDATTANRLGLHGAVLYVESEGTLEKFRPYSVLTQEYLERLEARLKKRFE
jgi:hypothetical protein